MASLSLRWWGPFAFMREEVDQVPRDLPGVYLLSVFSLVTPTLGVYYAGQSGDLLRRLHEHLRTTVPSQVRQRVSTYFSIAVVLDPLVRGAAEAALIRFYQPPGNVEIPAAPSINVSKPSLTLI